MNLQIRPAVRSDLEQISDNVVCMAFDARKIELSRDVVNSAVRTLFENPKLGFYLVAELEGEIVGSLLVTFEWSDWRNGVYWWIQSVYVCPEYRRRGIYRCLHEYLRNKAAADPAVIGLNLYVYKENEGARRAYEQLGMQESESLIYFTPRLKEVME